MSLEDGSFCYPQPLLWQLLISSQLQLFFFCKFITKRNNKKEKGEKGSNDLWKQARGTIIWAGPTGEIHSHVSEREGIQGLLLLLVCLFLLPPLFPLSRFHFPPTPSLLPPSRRRGRASEREQQQQQQAATKEALPTPAQPGLWSLIDWYKPSYYLPFSFFMRICIYNPTHPNTCSLVLGTFLSL